MGWRTRTVRQREEDTRAVPMPGGGQARCEGGAGAVAGRRSAGGGRDKFSSMRPPGRASLARSPSPPSLSLSLPRPRRRPRRRQAAVPPGDGRPARDPQVPAVHRAAHPQAALCAAGEKSFERASWGWQCACARLERERPCTPFLTSSVFFFLPLPQAREITNGVAPEPFRWTAEALLALQEVRRHKKGGGEGKRPTRCVSFFSLTLTHTPPTHPPPGDRGLYRPPV